MGQDLQGERHDDASMQDGVTSVPVVIVISVVGGRGLQVEAVTPMAQPVATTAQSAKITSLASC